MPNQIKKIFLSFLIFLTTFLSIAPNFLAANAATGSTWYNQSFKEWENKVDNPDNPQEIFGERYTAAQVQWIIYGLFAFILHSTINASALRCIMTSASDLDSCLEAAGIKLGDSSVQPITVTPQPEKRESLLRLVFADKPISGISYVKDKLQKFNPVPVAHAQTVGFGFNSLLVIQDMWRATRNVAFGLFIIAAVAFAFMIMFRVKINPQTVITIQSAIPKLIIALVLVTFSYAIAGFLIDLMYIVYGIVSLIGSKLIPSLPISPSSLFQFLTAGRLGIGSVGVDTGIFGLLALYLTTFPLALGIALFFTMGIILSSLTVLLTVGAVAAIAPLLATPIGWILGLIALILLAVIIILTLWNGIKIIWTLLKAFTFILLLTITAPLQIVAGVILPNFGFSNWLRSYVSNLAIFVTTSVLIFLAFIFMIFGVMQAANIVPTSGGVPHILGGYLANLFFGTSATNALSQLGKPTPWPPLIGAIGPLTGGATSLIGLLLLGVSFILFTLIPKAAQLVQSLVSGKPFAYGTALGEAFTGVRWAGNSVWSQSGGRDLWELAQFARKGRVLNQNLGEGGRLREPAKSFVGGREEQAENAIDAMLENYRKRSGRGEVR